METILQPDHLDHPVPDVLAGQTEVGGAAGLPVHGSLLPDPRPPPVGCSAVGGAVQDRPAGPTGAVPPHVGAAVRAAGYSQHTAAGTAATTWGC